jgi:hypothetical protein
MRFETNTNIQLFMKQRFRFKRFLVFSLLLGLPILSQAQSNGSNRTSQQVSGSREINYVSIPGFPAFVATGNQEADERAYQQAKARWIESNQAVYQQYLIDNRITNRKLRRPKTTDKP